MRLLAVVSQDGAVRSVLGWLVGVLQEVGVVLRRLFVFAADNMLIVAIIVAVIGVLLLRPPHAPR